MDLQVVLVCAFLCVLQFHTGSTECVKIQLRVPSSSINGNLQYTQFDPRVPYPVYRNGNNICRSCKGSICNSSCRSNNPFKFKSPPNGVVVSVPSDKSESGRLTITIDTRKPGNQAVPDVPTDNGEISEQDIDVVVKVVPDEVSGNQPTATSGSSSATIKGNDENLNADTKGIVDIPGGQALEVTVSVDDNNSGDALGKSTLDSDIIAENGEGKQSETDTQAEIINKPDEDSLPTDTSAPSDGNDSPVPGAEPAPVASGTNEPTPVAPDSGDSETPEVVAEPESSPPSDDDSPSASSAAASAAAADDKSAVAGSASGANADSGYEIEVLSAADVAGENSEDVVTEAKTTVTEESTTGTSKSDGTTTDASSTDKSGSDDTTSGAAAAGTSESSNPPNGRWITVTSDSGTTTTSTSGSNGSTTGVPPDVSLTSDDKTNPASQPAPKDKPTTKKDDQEDDDDDEDDDELDHIARTITGE